MFIVWPIGLFFYRWIIGIRLIISCSLYVCPNAGIFVTITFLCFCLIVHDFLTWRSVFIGDGGRKHWENHASKWVLFLPFYLNECSIKSQVLNTKFHMKLDIFHIAAHNANIKTVSKTIFCFYNNATL